MLPCGRYLQLSHSETRHPYGGPSPFLGCAIEHDGHPFGHCQSIIIWKWLIRWMDSPCLAWLFVWGVPGWSKVPLRRASTDGAKVGRAGLPGDLGSSLVVWLPCDVSVLPSDFFSSRHRPPRRKRHSVQVLLDPHRCSMQLLQHPLSLVWVPDHPSPTGRRPFTPSFPSTVSLDVTLRLQHSPDAEHTNP